MIWGVYGTSNLQLGPNSSIMIKPNPLFVEQITVEEIDNAKGGPMLYGLYRNPPLDIVATWSEAYKTSLPANTHKEWTYYFNAGSEISISYNVNSPSPSSLVLVIAQGKFELFSRTASVIFYSLLSKFFSNLNLLNGY
nr:uncharacterized protein LOC109159226 [Ipomoea batatas]